MAQIEPRLLPPETKPRVSVARLDEHWYIACRSKALKRKPLARTILGVPIVLFRTEDGQAAAMLDRCPHRNVPLSQGRVVGKCLQCVYHGWEWDIGGVCRAVPGYYGDPSTKGRQVPVFPTREQDGFTWVYATPDTEPDTEPFGFPLMSAEGYSTVYEAVSAHGSLHAVAENALDVPHTAYLHRGLFRGAGEPNEIDVVVRRTADRVEAEYLGEPRPSGIVGRILSPSGGVVTHFDRFILPSVIQVEYRIGTENHILVCAVGTPERDFFTTLHAVVSFKLRIPHWLVKPFLKPLALRIFKQDAAVLKLQTESIQRFGGEQFVSTEIDVLGRDIWRLLRMAERGELPDDDEDGEAEEGHLVERHLKLKA